MKSTKLIHEIVEKHGSQDNRLLMKDLKGLRTQVQAEVKNNITSGLQSIYKSTKNLY